MSNPYSAEKLGPAIMVTILGFLGVAVVGLLLWGLIALFMSHPVAAFLLVFGVLLFIGVVFLVQYLDDKYQWGLLDGWY